MARKHLTNGQKLSILNDCMARQAMGESLRSVARSHGIQPVQIRKKWKLKTNQLLSYKRGNGSLSRGREGRLGPFEEQIIGWALNKREAGFAIKYGHLRLYAIRLNPAFGELSASRQYHTFRGTASLFTELLTSLNAILKKQWTRLWVLSTS